MSSIAILPSTSKFLKKNRIAYSILCRLHSGAGTGDAGDETS